MNWLWVMLAAYVLLQAVALLRARPSERWLAGAPLALVVPAAVWALVGVRLEMNVSPLLLVLVLPLATLYVAVAAVMAGRGKALG